MTVEKLNALLARELGTHIYNAGKFKWAYSEDLYWPAYKTGRLTRRKIMVPLLGTAFQEEVETDIPEPEYTKDRMSHKLSKQWVICKWIPPDELTWWQSEFPGAPWPAQGYYFPTNASCAPGVLPTLADTEHLIRCVKDQTSMTYQARLADMEQDMDRQDKSKTSTLDSMIRNEFTAFMNPAPGKRGNHISMPYSRFDKSDPTTKETSNEH
jgi:hypothetical protein